MNLEQLLQRSDVWRGGTTPARASVSPDSVTGISTGHAMLNRQLPGGGWPLGALTEVLYSEPGIGEVTLLLPALVHMNQTGRWLAWITPPHLPYPHALAAAGINLARLLLIQPQDPQQAAWAMEQALRSGICGAVLYWADSMDSRILRRLQLAAEAGNAMGVLFRTLSARRHASPAALRVQLSPGAWGLELRILKCRGGWPAQPRVQLGPHAVA